jgi:GT2 family glycosyltransferase
MNDVSLSIVIPTFDHGDLLLDCLRSIHNQTVRPSEIIIVDDGSTENIRGMVRREFPDARVIRREFNAGFCIAANTGLREAASQFVLLLNNDMTLAPDCIELLLRRADPQTICTPLVLFQSDRDTVYSAGDCILTNGRPEPIGFRKPLIGFTMPERVLTVTGGAALIPRTVIEKIGYLDEIFLAYFEDADFCLRAWWAGFDCALVPEAVAYHVGSASLGGRTWRRSMLCFRNHALLVVKNFPVTVLLRFLPRIARERLHQLRMMWTSGRAEFGGVGAFAVFLAGTGSLMATLPGAIRARSHLRAGTRSNRAFVAMLTRHVDRQ